MLDRDKREALAKLSADSGAPMSELLRRSVGMYLNIPISDELKQAVEQPRPQTIERSEASE